MTVTSPYEALLTEEQAAQLQNVDCIIVLGCQVRSDGTPSHMLEDRLRRGVALYENIYTFLQIFYTGERILLSTFQGGILWLSITTCRLCLPIVN